MARQSPFLSRRRDTLAFRIAVPASLRWLLGSRELTRSLRTGDRRTALPRALAMAATAKLLFYELKLMAGSDEKKLLALVEAAKRKLDLAATKNEHDEELLGQRREFLRELEHTELRTKAAVLDQLVAAGLASRTEGRTADALAHSAPFPLPPTPDEAPMLSKVIGQFLTKYPAKKKEMLKKHQTVLRLLLEVLGDRPVSSLKQMDLNRFFDLLHRLPPRWSDELRKRKCSVRELSAMHHPKLMGPKTFDDTYKASVRAFLVAAKKDWRDQGFPEAIATDGIEYVGDRESDEKKQREFYPEELKRLFEGKEMRGFAADVRKAHYYWLPLLGLFTGARVNEICQINPVTDIAEADGILFFWLTIETEGDPRVSKSLKNKGSRRKLPIHSKLIELGFLNYVDSIRASGSKLIFPGWNPSKGRAAAEAEKWFRALLVTTGLRDLTPKRCLLGMHAFRSTLMNTALNVGVRIESITGHSDEDKSSVVKGYEGEVWLKNKKLLLEKITFDVNFIVPAHATSI